MDAKQDFRAVRRTFLAVVTIVLAGSLSAQEAPTGKRVLGEYGLSGGDLRDLESGEVVTKLASEYEQSKRELAIDATVVIRKPLDELLAESTDEATLVPGKIILDHGIIESEADLDRITLPADRAEEARYWLNASPGDDLNLGPTDLAIINRVKQGRQRGETDLDLASRAVREVLKHRYREYRAKGLAGVEPYQRSRKNTVAAGAELEASNRTLNAIEKYYPDYYETLVDFPRAACCDHRFLWLMAKVRGRPTFILVHGVAYDTPEVALLTERHYYVSHSLNNLQLTLAWLPWDESSQNTYMGFVTSANSDFLTGFKGKLIRMLGANKGAEMIGDVLVEIRDDLESGEDPTRQFDD